MLVCGFALVNRRMSVLGNLRSVLSLVVRVFRGLNGCFPFLSEALLVFGV